MRVAHEVHGQPFLRPGLGEVEPADRAVGKLRRQVQPERQRPATGLRRRRRQRVTPLQPAASGQVGDQVQPVDVEIEELAVPRHAGDQRATERRERRVECLHRAECRDVSPHDRAADGALAQERGERLHFGQLGHAVQNRVAGPV